MTVLLDANVLIALLVANHVHHESAEQWFADSTDNFATCPVTQGSLVRLLIRDGQSAETARNVVRNMSAHPRHEFWPDDLSYSDVPTTGIVGHRQVMDAYLAHITRVRRCRLATFDEGMAKLHHDVVDLIPARPA
jgi:toxin-antitoxin system PIN domain toxin